MFETHHFSGKLDKVSQEYKEWLNSFEANGQTVVKFGLEFSTRIAASDEVLAIATAQLKAKEDK